MIKDRGEVFRKLKELSEENNQLEEDLDYYKTKCSSLETGMFNLEREYDKLKKENQEKLKQSVNNLKNTIIKITIAYQRKYDRTIVDLVDEVHEEDITDLIKELKE